MKKLLVMLAAVAFLGLTVAVRPAAGQATDPVSVAKALIAAENAHNVEGALALFASDAVVTLPTGKLSTRADIEKWQRELAAGNFHAEISEPRATGERVTFTGTVALDMFRNLGLQTLDSMWDLTVQQGKVKTFNFSFTPEAGARLQSALAARQPMADTGIDLRDNPTLLGIAAAALLLGSILTYAGRRRRPADAL